MNIPNGMNLVLLSFVLSLAVLYDASQDRVPNFLCLAGGLLAILETGYHRGWEALVFSLLAAIFLFFLLFPFWIVRVVGAGDVKLMMVSGLFLGRDSLNFLICAGLCTALISFIFMIWRHNFFKRLFLFGDYVRHCFQNGKLLPYPFHKKTEKNDGGIHVTYGILAGHLVAWILGLYGSMR